ncbi:ATP-binding protein [Streptomyces sp. NPDC046805]|uniref:ATP-binding protein n=1 Tax=Streptomyces sp. NPDC046805 TaxID=3155134 RepID=UPI003406DC23
MTPQTESPTARAPHLCFRSSPRPPACAREGGLGRVAVFGFLPRRERVPQVRHAVTGLLGYWGVGSDLRDTAALAVSELTANAVLHAPASTSITVLIEVASHLHIEVRDGSRQLPALQTPDGDDGESEHGRGLALVAALCSEWGTTVYGDGGKSVWAHFPLPRATEC